MAGTVLPLEHTAKLTHTGRRAGVAFSVKTMQDCLAPKGELEVSLVMMETTVEL